MAQFHLKLTEGGVALLAKAAAGKPLSFQKMVMGDGNYSGDPAAMEAVISPKKELSIYRLSRNGNKVSVRSVLTLNQVTAPFWWRELGLYAADPDGGGLVLAAYGNAMDKADYIAAGGVLEERIVDVSLMVDTAAQITAEASGVVFAGEEAFQSHKGDRAVHVTMLTHVRSSATKVHTLSGLGSVSGVFACQFKATAAFVTGDTFRVNGSTYALKLQNGETAEDNLFVSGALVSCIIDTAGKTVNFKAAGGQKLPAGTSAIVKIFNADGTFTVPQTGKYRVTVVGKGGNGGKSTFDRNSWGENDGSGGSGGSGGWASSELNLTKGASVAVTVGAVSSFGSYLSAAAGADAASPDPSEIPAFPEYVGGAGGTATGGTLRNVSGISGSNGTISDDRVHDGAAGKAVGSPEYSAFLSAAFGQAGTGSSRDYRGYPPIADTGYGAFGASGGGAACNTNYSGGSGLGGEGGPGAVIIEMVLD